MTNDQKLLDEYNEAVAQRAPAPAPVTNPLLDTPATMKPRNVQEALDLAQALAKTDLVPKNLRGKPQETLLLIMNALSRGKDVLDHLQSRYVVAGQVGMSAVSMIAEANASGIFKGVLRFEWSGKGDDLKCRCYAYERGDTAHIEYTFSMAEAKAAGFTSNKKYREIPKQMLAYRAATFFVRLYCPHVLAGAMTDMEIQEMGADNDTSQDAARAAELTQQYSRQDRGLNTDLEHIND